MAIAFDAVSFGDTFGASSVTFAHTVAAGGVLVVFAYIDDDGIRTVTGVTYNGTAMTQLLATTNDASSGVSRTNSAWVIHNPTTGSAQNIVVTASATVNANLCAHGISYTGVANGSAAATHRTIFHAGDGGGGTGVDVTVTDSVSGDLVVASCCTLSATLSAGSGMTSRRFDQDVSGNTASMGVEDTSATGANTVMSFTGDNFCTNIAFALIAAASGVTAAQEAGIWAAMNSGGVIGRVDA